MIPLRVSVPRTGSVSRAGDAGDRQSRPPVQSLCSPARGLSNSFRSRAPPLLTGAVAGVDYAPSSAAGSGLRIWRGSVNELGFKVLVAMWLIFGLISIVLLFRRGLARNLLRTFAERYGSATLGWVAIVLLMPIMI